jgi:uncharacterized protein (DUF2267 family)
MQYDDFIKRVQQYAGFASPDDAKHLTEVFLATLGRPLSRSTTNTLAAQLPKELKESLFATPRETAPSDPFKFGAEDFYNQMKGRLDVPIHEAQRQARAVGRALREAVSDGEMRAVFDDLPDGFKDVFRQG